MRTGAAPLTGSRPGWAFGGRGMPVKRRIIRPASSSRATATPGRRPRCHRALWHLPRCYLPCGHSPSRHSPQWHPSHQWERPRGWHLASGMRSSMGLLVTNRRREPALMPCAPQRRNGTDVMPPAWRALEQRHALAALRHPCYPLPAVDHAAACTRETAGMIVVRGTFSTRLGHRAENLPHARCRCGTFMSPTRASLDWPPGRFYRATCTRDVGEAAR